MRYIIFVSADAEQDEADGGQLWGWSFEGFIPKLRAAQQSQTLPRPGKITAPDGVHWPNQWNLYFL